jgi:MFS family permease
MGETRLDRIKTILRVTSGNFLEMYDFFLFGIYARQIGQTFFPSDDPYASLMATFVSFAAGFAMRPIGALTLGPYIDRIGRRKGLILTLSIMACGTILIAFVPGYATIGVLAPMLVVLGRLLQGFSAGVELGGVSVYLSEMATPGNKGLYVSWQSASQQVAVVFAALLGYAIANRMAPETASNWGWRIPFFIGCAIVPFLYMIRRRLEETPEFAARKVHPTTAQIFATLGANWPIVLGGVAMVMMTTVSFYLITVYTPTFGRSVLKLTDCGRGVEFCLAAVVGSPVGPDRPQADPPHLCNYRPSDRLSGARLAGAGADLRPHARSRTVAIVHLRLLQWRDGRGVDRGHPGFGADIGLLTRLQPRDHAWRFVAFDLDLAHRPHRRQGRARLLDELRGGLRPDRDACALSPAEGRRALFGDQRRRGRLGDPVALVVSRAMDHIGVSAVRCMASCET